MEKEKGDKDVMGRGVGGRDIPTSGLTAFT